MNLTLDSSITLISGVGPARAEQLALLGIETIKDLLYYAPFRYETVERELQIQDLIADQTVCIHAEVVSKVPIRTQRFKSMLKVRVQDASGVMDLTWFNNQFVLKMLKIGESYYFTGKVAVFKNHPTITNPSIERQTPEMGTLVPIYHESADINSRYLRKLIRLAFEQTDLTDRQEMMAIYKRHQLVSLKEALECLHQLSAVSCQLSAAKQRLAFDEMFFLIRDVMEHKKLYQQSIPVARLATTNDEIKVFSSLFPYALTPSQKDAIQSISLDLVQPHPMHRLIQGEVGSGKTTVAAYALWVCAKAGQKAVLICPTNILAQQHFDTLTRIFSQEHTANSSQPQKKSAISYQLSAVSSPSIGLYTGKEKNSDADILVGTHALFNIKGHKPALVIIDEEHRFGVEQRESFFRLKKKPHFLSMTATPIPRTVALTALADRDVSFITPHKDNSNIKTWVIPKEKRTNSYTWIKETLKKTGGQALIVCPFIEESLVENLMTVKSAKQEFLRLQKVFSGYKLDLLHGSLKPKDKDLLFAKVMAGKTDILVTTPVVEVGVDIPKANIIVIEGAERYGLAGLHQLRGRVGRRGQEAYCLLFTTDPIENEKTRPELVEGWKMENDQSTSEFSTLNSLPADATRPALQAGQFSISQKRLSFFAKTYDGNALAEYDLKHRGSGELLGIRQHGFDSLRFASWSDIQLIEQCKKEVNTILE